ncbi:MAG: gamma-glutamyltransferase [Myxococcota bacterium]|nr:gamma-glutamyltransferase [Myxococcota bacterium]
MTTLSEHHPGGIVSAGDIQTARAGAIALERGGNAIDAAVAASLAAFVCEVALCGPVGGGVMVAKLADGTQHAVDFFGRTPGLGLRSRPELDFGEATIDFGVASQSFKVGRGAAAIGLALPGLLEIHHRWGQIPLSEVAEPAIILGRQGFVVGAPMAYILRLISAIFSWTPESKALCYVGDRLPTDGDRLFNHGLASVLETVARQPSEVRGVYAQFAREFGPSRGGLITSADLDRMAVDFHQPIETTMNGWSFATMPPPSTGGCLIGLGLRLLEGIGERCEAFSEDYYRTMVDVQRRLLEVRTHDFDTQIREGDYLNRLLSKEFVDELSQRTLVDAALEPSHPLGSTTQISAMDDAGGVVALTLTNGEGCGCVLSGTGIQVNNLLGEADINPRGFHVDPPGLAMSTMMAPSVVHRGADRFALGSGGSNRLRNAIMMTVTNLIEFGLSPRTSVDSGRVHLERAEHGFELNFEGAEHSAALRSSLASLYDRHTEFPGRNMFFGGVHSVFNLNGTLSGIGDPRRGGHVARPGQG